MTSRFTAISAAVLFALAGCKGIGVDLATSQPIKVDVNVKLDVYQHTDPGAQKKTAAASDALPPDVKLRRKNRMGEVQSLKDSRAVGENHLGLLEIRQQPPGEYGDYTKKLVDDENKDRTAIMQELVRTGNLKLDEVQKQQAELSAKLAYNGEWIEAQQANGSWLWVQKGVVK